MTLTAMADHEQQHNRRLINAQECITFARALLIGGVAVGLLDATDGVIFFGLTAHDTPVTVLQYIASGVLGASAYQDGLAAAGLGLVFHVALSFFFAGLYLLAATRVAALWHYAIVIGPLYGVAINLLMTFVVLPHTNTTVLPVTTASFLNGIIGHALFVGLPAALATRAYLTQHATPAA